MIILPHWMEIVTICAGTALFPAVYIWLLAASTGSVKPARKRALLFLASWAGLTVLLLLVFLAHENITFAL